MEDKKFQAKEVLIKYMLTSDTLEKEEVESLTC